MRRPPPLPSTPPPRRDADTPAPEAPARPRRAAARRSAPPAGAVTSAPAADVAVPDDTETMPLGDLTVSGPVAPIVPFAAPPASTPPAPAPPTEPTGEPPVGADTDTERPTGIRDVWAAARARRRALRREIRRFTVRQRRRRHAWMAGIAAVLLVGLGAVGVAYSPLFAVDEITVVGTDRLDPAVVEDALADQRGTPLALVDSSAVKAALVSFPLVESYTIEARPPQELVVRIVERTPVGVVQARAGFTLVDAAGVVLATTADAPEGFPVIEAEGGVGSRAFRAVGAVYRSLPADLQARVSAMSATTPEDVVLAVDGADVRWGNADDAVEKAGVLSAAMTARPPADVEEYDVSSPGAVVIR